MGWTLKSWLSSASLSRSRRKLCFKNASTTPRRSKRILTEWGTSACTSLSLRIESEWRHKMRTMTRPRSSRLRSIRWGRHSTIHRSKRWSRCTLVEAVVPIMLRHLSTISVEVINSFRHPIMVSRPLSNSVRASRTSVSKHKRAWETWTCKWKACLWMKAATMACNPGEVSSHFWETVE